MRDYFINLSNGLICNSNGCFPDRPLKFVRIQSTWCEQKRWAPILDTLGADFLMALAEGRNVVVHDKSEKNRQTRAGWQGLSWIRYACMHAWYDVHTREWSRSGVNVSDYWEEQYHKLPRGTRSMLRYFRRYAAPWPFDLRSCLSWTVTPPQEDSNVIQFPLQRDSGRQAV